MNPLLIGGALGAVAMYFLDGRSGRRRRARTPDQGLSAAAADPALVSRVRSALGRVVSHPHPIEVGAEDGHVTLDGPILAHEVRPLLKCVRHVDGVRGVSDRLTVYEDASHLLALQGGRPRKGGRFELLQENWSPAARLLTGALGAAMLLRASQRRAMSLAVAGGGLLARAVSNRSIASLLGLADASQGIVVQKTIHVDAPVARVYAFWTDYQNFPRFMHNVREVQVYEDRSHWVVAGPAGVPVQWEATLTRLIVDRLIEWRSIRGSTVRHQGRVRFDPVGGGTQVNVRLSYVPPAGAFGHAVATLFGADPKTEMDADLMRMKAIIEGRPPPGIAERRAVPRES